MAFWKKKYSNLFFRSPTTYLKIKRRLIQAWIWPLLISNGVEIMVCLDIIFTGTHLKVNDFQNVPFLLMSGIREFTKDNRNNFGLENVKRVLYAHRIRQPILKILKIPLVTYFDYVSTFLSSFDQLSTRLMC